MKITKLFAITLFLFSTALTAQEVANQTLGLRLGDSDGFGAEISYQKSINRYSRLEFGVGYRDSREYDALKVIALFQKVNNISRGFNWYYGFGGGAGTAKFELIPNKNNPNIAEEPEGGLFVLAAAAIGVEYNFDNLPILISLDIRPEIGILGYQSFEDKFDFDIGLGLRYQF